MNYIIIFSAKYLYLIAILIAALVWLRTAKKIKLEILKLAIVNLPISFILGRIAGLIFYNPRPFIAENIMPLMPHAADNGFPSDHTLLIATIAFCIISYNKRYGIILLIFALVVGLSRVIAKIHYPLDILGSFIISFIAFCIAINLLNKNKKLNLLLDRVASKIKLPR